MYGASGYKSGMSSSIRRASSAAYSRAYPEGTNHRLEDSRASATAQPGRDHPEGAATSTHTHEVPSAFLALARDIGSWQRKEIPGVSGLKEFIGIGVLLFHVAFNAVCEG